jgi:NADH/NAD ratio-sensing transcriptional regulator Rex
MKQGENKMTSWENANTAIIDFGYIGRDTKTGEIVRTGDEEKKIAKIELPELSGTEKQIAWAIDIRVDKIHEIEQTIERFGFETALSQFKVETAQEVFDMILAGPRYSWLATTTNAHNVIENRY